MSTKLTFEDRLLEQLRQVVATNPASPEPVSRRSPQRRMMLVTGGVGAAAAAVVLFALGGSGASNAYAVDTQPNGFVAVHISSLSDASGLQSSLRAAGIPAVVSYSANCTPPWAPAPVGSGPGTAQAGGHVEQTPAPAGVNSAGVALQVTRDADGVTFKLDPGTIGADQKLFITTATGQVDSVRITISEQAPPPAC